MWMQQFKDSMNTQKEQRGFNYNGQEHQQQKQNEDK